jgi:hypothetical protein
VESNAYLGSLESEGSLEQTARHLGEGPKKVAGGDQGQRIQKGFEEEDVICRTDPEEGLRRFQGE